MTGETDLFTWNYYTRFFKAVYVRTVSLPPYVPGHVHTATWSVPKPKPPCGGEHSWSTNGVTSIDYSFEEKKNILTAAHKN